VDDPPPFTEHPEATGRRSNAATPRWVKAFGAVAAVLIALFAILHLAGRGFGGHGGMHGLGVHSPASDAPDRGAHHP
jgi:hypothetical protein